MSNTITTTNTSNSLHLVLRNSERFKKIDTKAYLSNQSCEEMFAKITTVLGCTGLGAGIGALAGLPEGGIGAGPGAAIGAGAGFVAGLMWVSSWTACSYKDWAKGQKQEIVTGLMNDLKDVLKDSQLTCPITQEIPVDPVVTPHSGQVYERQALEQWVSKTGTDPITHHKMTLKDINHSPATMGIIHHICHKIASGEMKRNLSPAQLIGISKMKEDADQNRRNFFLREKDRLMDRVTKKELSIRDAGDLFQKLCNTIDPKDPLKENLKEE